MPISPLRRPVGTQRLAQPEHARRRRDAPDAAARIVGRARQPEQLRVRQHAARGANAAGHLGVGAPVAVQIDRLAVDRDVDVAIPRDARQRRPVARVRVHQRRRRIARGRAFVGPDVFYCAFAIARARRARPRPRIDDVGQHGLSACGSTAGAGGGDFRQPCAEYQQQQDRDQRVITASPCASRTSSLPPAPCWRRWRR